MTAYRLVAEPRADLDVAATFDWYENEEAGLGQNFLDELRAAYDRIADGPLAYQTLRSGIRRGLLRRFPYAVYFAVEIAPPRRYSACKSARSRSRARM